MSLNRISNTSNRFQGPYKRVLCVCSAGMLRSPTAALVLSQDPFSFNTRACGVSPDYALIILDQVLLEWAQEIVVMDKYQQKVVKELLHYNTPIINLEIPDNYEYRHPELVELIKKNYMMITGFTTTSK